MTQIPEHERFVGTDVAKNQLDLHLLPEGKAGEWIIRLRA